MNLKLEVIKVNEDVIATSLCDYYYSIQGHAKITNHTGTSYDIEVFGDLDGDGSLESITSFQDRSDLLDKYTSNGWYYTDEGGDIKRCENQNDSAHPIDPVDDSI